LARLDSFVNRGRLFYLCVLAASVVLFVCVLAGAAVARYDTTSSAIPDRPLRTAVYIDPLSSPWTGRPAATALDQIRRTGATVARITLYWYDVAPATEPSKWRPPDPADPHYNWSHYDALIRGIVEHGLDPLVTIMAAPTWAQGAEPEPPLNSYLPDPDKFGQFSQAAARRYSGSFRGLPRVRWWQAWNEPNISLYFVPQLENGKPVSPAWYRRMLNRFAIAVHGVHRDNVVVAAGLAPFRDITEGVQKQDKDWGPLSFMRELLCLSKSLKPTCDDRVSFDVWATHPYTSGGPLHHAAFPNDVSLGDLPKMRRVLDAAIKAKHIDSRGAVQFWVTEFSWDSNPPDADAVPMKLLTRWVAEGLFRMWQNGISLVTWLMLEDLPTQGSYLQSGLYFTGSSKGAARPKPILEAFRFPVVALPSNRGVVVWGRTPVEKSGTVVVERSSGRGWQRLAVVPTNRFGIFQRTLRVDKGGTIRARLIGSLERSQPFGIKPVLDHFYNPFGSPSFEPPGPG
jgi:hypothetical protein